MDNTTELLAFCVQLVLGQRLFFFFSLNTTLGKITRWDLLSTSRITKHPHCLGLRPMLTLLLSDRSCLQGLAQLDSPQDIIAWWAGNGLAALIRCVCHRVREKPQEKSKANILGEDSRGPVVWENIGISSLE